MQLSRAMLKRKGGVWMGSAYDAASTCIRGWLT